jgi:hypothetical protein
MDLATPGIVFQIGVEPVRVDILTSVDPLSFSDAAAASVAGAFAGVPIRVIGRDHLMAAKRYANRLQDRIDVRSLAAAARPDCAPPEPRPRRRPRRAIANSITIADEGI